MEILNLLNVVNETRLSSCKALEARPFFKLSLKLDVHSVWLARGGRKRLKVTRIQLIIPSIRHETNLTTISLDKVSIFHTAG